MLAALTQACPVRDHTGNAASSAAFPHSKIHTAIASGLDACTIQLTCHSCCCRLTGPHTPCFRSSMSSLQITRLERSGPLMTLHFAVWKEARPFLGLATPSKALCMRTHCYSSAPGPQVGLVGLVPEPRVAVVVPVVGAVVVVPVPEEPVPPVVVVTPVVVVPPVELPPPPPPPLPPEVLEVSVPVPVPAVRDVGEVKRPACFRARPCTAGQGGFGAGRDAGQHVRQVWQPLIEGLAIAALLWKRLSEHRALGTSLVQGAAMQAQRCAPQAAAWESRGRGGTLACIPSRP